jgi:hypothetical protein
LDPRRLPTRSQVALGGRAASEELNEVLEALEARGVVTFPVGLDKTPSLKWKGIPAETPEQRLARWRQWLDAGRASLVAAIPGDRYSVLDVDKPEAFQTAVGPVEVAGPQVLTPAGGFQVWAP